MIALVRKIPWLVGTLFAVSFLTYTLISLLPGDPALQILGVEGASAEAILEIRSELGLDRPLLVRYFDWLGNTVTGDLGRSYITRQPVLDAILERLPVTAQLGLMAMLIALIAALPLAMVSAYHVGGWIDRGVTSFTFGLLAVPGFMMAILLILVFAVTLGWLPASGWVPFRVDPWRNISSALLPAIAIASAELALYTRLLRSDLISTLQQDFIVLARAKGLATSRILFRHALRPASFSLLTVVGLQLGSVISGAIIIEEIFALPGIGRLLIQSIYQRDLMMVQGIVLFVASAYVVANFLIDVSYSYLDPRLRHVK